MASLITVRLDKGNSPNLGFRLQGGKDFGTPLVVQKVNGGSPAERAGLIAGDSVIKINNVDVFNLRHKDAQDVIIRAGPAFEVTVQRGGSVWKPAVIPTGPLHSPAPAVTKTSLAATKKDNFGSVGTGHNLAAKPFSPQLNGTVNGGPPKVVNNQYNSPLKLYSEESIAETLSAQTEVLSTGVLGVNFKKNEKGYDATNSAVYRMLQEAEKEPKTPEAVSPRSDLHARQVTSPRSNTSLDDHSRLSSRLGDYPNSYIPNQEGVTKCSECERVIVGVFVRIKDKNLHVECFKCSTCGTSLKNVGYYNINNKLYCDVHAKLAARANPLAPNLLPITVPPGGKAPASAISTALATHSLPSPSPLSPKTNFAQPFQAGNYSSAPKPFSSVSAPISSPTYNTLPRAAPSAAPLSPVALAPAPSYSPSSVDRSAHTFVWPPLPQEPEVPTACPLYVAPSSHLKVIPKTIKQEDVENSDTISESEDFEVHEFIMYQQPKLSVCSEEVSEITGRRSAEECVETISETLETQKLIESVMKNRPRSPPPVDRDVVVSEIKKTAEIAESIETSQKVCSLERSSVASCESTKFCELKRLTDFKPNTLECQLKSQIENVVPQKWESPMVQALRTIPGTSSKDSDPFTQIPTKVSSGVLASALAIAPSEPFTAQPYTSIKPVPLPEETVPYFPPEHPLIIEPKEPKPEKPDSQFVKALQTAPERPFTPVGGAPVKKKKDPTDEFFKDLPKPQNKLTMREALMTASDRPYSPFVPENVNVSENVIQECKLEKKKENIQKPLKPSVLPVSFQKPLVDDKPRAPKPFPITTHEMKEEISLQEKKVEKEIDVKTSSMKVIEKHQTQNTVEESIGNVDDDKSQGMYPLFKGFSCSFGNKSEHSQFKIEICTTPPIINKESSQTPTVKISRTGASSESITETVTEESKMHEKSHQQTKQIEKQSEKVEIKKPSIALSLHKPEKLPQYQVNLYENAEADILMRQKMETAKIQQQEKSRVEAPPKPPREFQPKPVITVQPSEPSKELQTKPVVTVQPGGSTLQPTQMFKPVCEERPPSSTFSPRPRPITPSMINKPPPTLPYYQSSLVAQQYRAPQVNLLDPTSPAISRSPSPCPEARSSSPFPSKAAAAVRPKSPAAGPPPNPLTSGKPLPTPRDARVEEAKKNVSHYIPQYRERIDGVEKVQPGPPQIYSAYVQSQNIAGVQEVQSAVSSQQSLQVDAAKKCIMKEDRRVEDAAIAQLVSQQSGQATMSTAIFEKTHSDHLEQLKKSESQSVENLQGGAVQVHRKKTVTEEFEHTQKSKFMQIEKNVSATKNYPFRDVKNPEQQAILGMHLTNPQPIVSPFLRANASQQDCAPSPKQQTQPKQPIIQQQIPPPHAQAPPPHAQAPPPHTQAPPLQQYQTPQIPKPFKHVSSPSTASPIKHVPAPSGSAKKPDQSVNKSNIPVPNAGSGSGGGRQAGAIGVVPKRGRGILNTAALTGTRIPLCASCHSHIRGPFITALGKIWCPTHFICATPSCRRPLQDLGFVEEQGQLHCEYCFEQYLAPTCAKCNVKVKGDCLKAIGKNYHPECFNCFYCGKLFGNSPFFLEDGNPYCDTDWNELFTTKCFACGFPVEAGDRWVEALNNNYHSQCFNCTMCKKNLEGQSFFAKGGRPFCKNHAR